MRLGLKVRGGRGQPLSLTLWFGKFRGLMHGGRYSAVIGLT